MTNILLSLSRLHDNESNFWSWNLKLIIYRKTPACAMQRFGFLETGECVVQGVDSLKHERWQWHRCHNITKFIHPQIPNLYKMLKLEVNWTHVLENLLSIEIIDTREMSTSAMTLLTLTPALTPTGHTFVYFCSLFFQILVEPERWAVAILSVTVGRFLQSLPCPSRNGALIWAKSILIFSAPAGPRDRTGVVECESFWCLIELMNVGEKETEWVDKCWGWK